MCDTGKLLGLYPGPEATLYHILWDIAGPRTLNNQNVEYYGPVVDLCVSYGETAPRGNPLSHTLGYWWTLITINVENVVLLGETSNTPL